MSKSSFFLLLLSGAFLTAAGLQSGGAWLGDVRSALQYEARADIASLRDDVRDIRAQAEPIRGEFKALWNDASGGFRTLEADVKLDGHTAARRISTM